MFRVPTQHKPYEINVKREPIKAIRSSGTVSQSKVSSGSVKTVVSNPNKSNRANESPSVKSEVIENMTKTTDGNNDKPEEGKTFVLPMNAILRNPEKNSETPALRISDCLYYAQILRKMWLEKIQTDMTFVTSTKEFPCHKAVVCAASSRFSLICVGTDPVIDLSQTASSEAVEDMLSFIYTRTTPNLEISVREVLKLGLCYELNELVCICRELLLKRYYLKNKKN